MSYDLVAAIECLLFVADAPVTIADLAEAVERPRNEVEEALVGLAGRLNTGGLQLVRIAGGYQICTKRDYADAVAKFLQPQKQRLSRSALEVLAIVAYRQPLTSAEIEEVRGVQSDYAIRTLVDKNLIHEVERRQSPGRPILWGTTQFFLHQFKLNDLSQLPPLESQEVLLEEVSA